MAIVVSVMGGYIWFVIGHKPKGFLLESEEEEIRSKLLGDWENTSLESKDEVHRFDFYEI